MRNFSLGRRWAVLALVIAGAVVAVPVVHGKTLQATEREIGWLSSHPVQLFIRTPHGPGDGPVNARPRANIFAIAPIYPAHPQGRGGRYPAPPGAPPGSKAIVIPMRDTVLPRAIPAKRPADCFGSYVEMGPHGNAKTVMTRRDPNGSGLRLAYALRLNGHMRLLTDQATIKRAVDGGLLRLDASLGYGGVCWSGKGSSHPASAPKAAAPKPSTQPTAAGFSSVRTFKEVTTQYYFGQTATYPKPPGRGAGDVLFSTGALYEGAQKVGENTGSCLTVADSLTEVQSTPGSGVGVPVPTPSKPANLRADCQYIMSLDGGTLVIQGLFNQTHFEGDCATKAAQQFCSGSTETLAVLGGTGRFIGATGQLLLTQVSYPDVTRLVLQLR